MNSHELIGPKTDLHEKQEKIQERFSADVKEKFNQIDKEGVSSKPNELTPNEPFLFEVSTYAKEIREMNVETELDYGEMVEGLLLTTRY